MQRLCDVVRFAVGGAIGHRHRRREIVVESCTYVYLWQQSGTVLADVVLAFENIALIGFQIKISLNAHL